jgi:hypothetical protein
MICVMVSLETVPPAQRIRRAPVDNAASPVWLRAPRGMRHAATAASHRSIP